MTERSIKERMEELELVIADQNDNIWLRLREGSGVSDTIMVKHVLYHENPVILGSLDPRMKIRAEITRGPLELKNPGEQP